MMIFPRLASSISILEKLSRNNPHKEEVMALLKKAAKQQIEAGRYSVCVYFVDGSMLRVSENITDNAAYEVLQNYSRSLGAKVGTTKRIIVIIDDDETNVYDEWKYAGCEV